MNYLSKLQYTCAIFLFALLAGCNGDDDNNEDTSPDDFDMDSQTEVPLSEYIESEIFEISGINTETEISIVGGEYSINNGAFTDSESTVENEDLIQVRVMSADTIDTESEADAHNRRQRGNIYNNDYLSRTYRTRCFQSTQL